MQQCAGVWHQGGQDISDRVGEVTCSWVGSVGEHCGNFYIYRFILADVDALYMQ